MDYPAKRQIDVTQDIREIGVAGAVGFGCGMGAKQVCLGILELSPRKFFGGLLMLTLTLSLGLGWVIGEELAREEEVAELVAHYD